MSFDPYTIVKCPLITEKSTAAQPDRKYVFQVATKANKFQVKMAVEAIYKVHVTKVGVVNVPRKQKRYRANIQGYTPGYKKAVVTLREGDKIATTQ